MNLVFSGSGMLYPVFVGAYKALYEAGELDNLQKIAGTSGGSIIAALIATGYGRTPYVLERTILELLPVENRLIDWAWWPFRKMGFVKGNRLLRKFAELFEGRSMNQCQIHCTIPVVNLDSGETLYLSSKNEYRNWNLADAVRSSISIPFVFQPFTDKHGVRYVDGGLGDNFAIDLFDSKTIGIRINSGVKPKKVRGLLSLFNRIVEVMMAAIEKKHIEDAVYADIMTIKIQGSSLNFKMTRKEAKALIDQGYSQTKRWLEERA